MTRDYKTTVFLPQTDLPMKAGLPKREGEWLQQWQEDGLDARRSAAAQGRPRYVLHDGPPYANGDIHIGHAMNKILKDIVVRTYGFLGYDAPYVPGWDCHGLPIEWKIEEKYRKKGKSKDDVDPIEFRKECRVFADHWVNVQKEQFKRLGIAGDWDNPYLTMSYDAEATIVEELLKVAKSGALYRGAKPVMWSPVEKTALAEAEIEYHDHVSTQIDVAFPVIKASNPALDGAEIVIWTTTPWTIPANRAICYGDAIDYVVVDMGGRKLVLAEALLGEVKARLGVEELPVLAHLKGSDLNGTICAHPWRGQDYDYDVPLLSGDHVTVEAGTGFVHTAPGHGEDDFYVCQANGIDVPQTVGPDGRYYDHMPLVAGEHVYKVAPKICELLGSALLASSDFSHSYPHSWRSKAPLIFRTTAQWFISMEKTGIRDKALQAIDEVNWYPKQSKNRIRAMVADRPDWVISRQRAWGVPITLFVHKASGEILVDDEVNARIVNAVAEGGADAWFSTDPQDLLGNQYSAADYERIGDILDVWFDSGCTHAFVMEAREKLRGAERVLYLEGSDQHRGWFQSSLLESCATRGKAPYTEVLTHGFTMDSNGRKMSKSLGNTVHPQKVIDQYGADILRLWVASTDYQDDVRIGDEILRGQVDAYRKIRNTFRFMLGNLANFSEEERLDIKDMPELERWVLHRLAELDIRIRAAIENYDWNKVYTALHQFCILDLSAFYFDIRKDALYCDGKMTLRRRATRTVLDQVFHRLTRWFAPILVFTADEVWRSRFGDSQGHVHEQLFMDVPKEWQDDALAAKWKKVRDVRRVVTGALELKRRDKVIGASLQAAPVVHVINEELSTALQGLDLAEIFITSGVTLSKEAGPEDAFTMPEIEGVAVEFARAEGEKCQRCWQILPEVKGEDGICNRCADAVAAFDEAAA